MRFICSVISIYPEDSFEYRSISLSHPVSGFAIASKAAAPETNGSITCESWYSENIFNVAKLVDAPTAINNSA
jgi:hypothetical protein